MLLEKRHLKFILFFVSFGILSAIWFRSPGASEIAPIISILFLENSILDSQGIMHKYDGEQWIWPVFIGEVAYKEKKIAMSYTKKEVISSNNQWVFEFESL